MVDIGDVIEVDGEQGLVCFKTDYNDTQYICVSFDNPSFRYDIFKYKVEDNKLMVSLLEDEEEIKQVLKIFADESINEYGMPEELQKILESLNAEQ